MKVIKIRLEYGCFPVWIYDENGKLVENDLPSYLVGDDVDSWFAQLQETYNSLFLDDGREFAYIGFKDSGKEESFYRELNSAIQLLKNKLNDNYSIEEGNH